LKVYPFANGFEGTYGVLGRLSGFVGYKMHATDGYLGHVTDFYFDDATWTIRYLVTDIGHWLAGRKVLISRAALGKPDWALRAFPVKLSKDEVRRSPDIVTQEPISRQHEFELHKHYGWAPYWGSGYYTGPMYEMALTMAKYNPPPREPGGAPHLRSTQAVLGYRVHAIDGEVGHMEDYIADDEKWSLRFLVVDTSRDSPGVRVLLSPCCIENLDWFDSEIHINLSRESVRNMPVFDPARPISADYEDNLHEYYERCKGHHSATRGESGGNAPSGEH